MKGFTLHARQRKLLYLLNSNHTIMTGKELSERIGVSERTVRSDIVEINQIMKDYDIQVKAARGKGYHLQVEDRSILHELFSEMDNIQTKEDRIKYLIVNLVYSSEWVDLRELEDDMYVSRTTLENDLKDIRSRISENQPFLPLLRNGNYTRFEEDEIKRRNILIRVYSENWDFNSQDGIFLKEAVIKEDLLNQIRQVIKHVLKDYEFELDDFGMIYLSLAFAISYSRILTGHLLLEFKEASLDPTALKAANEMWDSLNVEWELELSEHEYEWIADILKKLTLINLQSYSVEDTLQAINPQCVEKVQVLIDEIKDYYSLDFTEDSSFYISLLRHTQAIYNNMISIQTQSQYMIEELRMQYPYLGEIAQHLCNKLSSFCGRKLGNEEEDYLLPLLVLARINLLHRKSKKGFKVAVVSHLNTGLSNYFISSLRRQYGSRIDFAGPFPIYDRSKIDQVQPSFVITTVSMDMFRQFDIPVITVSPLLEEEDLKKIELCIKVKEEEYLYPKLPYSNESYFRKELFVAIDRRVSLTEALNILEENLRSNLYLDEEVPFEWEQCYKTVLSNGVLFLYVLANEAQRTILSVAMCKHMLNWNQTRNIKQVVVLILNKNERRYLGSFYHMISQYAKESIEEL